MYGKGIIEELDRKGVDVGCGRPARRFRPRRVRSVGRRGAKRLATEGFRAFLQCHWAGLSFFSTSATPLVDESTNGACELTCQQVRRFGAHHVVGDDQHADILRISSMTAVTLLCALGAFSAALELSAIRALATCESSVR